MGNEDDAYTLVFQLVHQLKQFLHLVIIQRGSRFVKNQNFTVHIHGTCDRDHLLQRQRILFQILSHINIHIQILHDLF